MHDVFISYSTKDIDVTERVRQVLETNGIVCWIAPRNIPSGSSYAAEIPAAIRGCSVFLLIGSLHAEASPWIRKELERAIIERKKIIPLMVEDVAFQDEFDFLLSLHQRYIAYEKTAEVMETLVRDIRAMLGKPAPVKEAPKASAPPAKKNPEPIQPAEDSFAPAPRYDGFYRDCEGNGACTYYRFFPNGKVVSAFTPASPFQVYQWLNESYSNAGKVDVKKSGTWMTEPLSDGHSYLAKLTFKDDKLIMDGYNSYANRGIIKTCTFVPFNTISKLTVNPRFDGYYLDIGTPPKPIVGNLFQYRNYYRFYPDGKVIHAYSIATPDTVAKWTDEEWLKESFGPDNMRYAEENGELWVTTPLKEGNSYHAKITVDGLRLVMEGPNTFLKKDVRIDCLFNPFNRNK